LQPDFISVSARLGMKVATPVFDGASEDDIEKLLEQAGLPVEGHARARHQPVWV
jgi:DNA-directed RNA polymerase beta subunit